MSFEDASRARRGCVLALLAFLAALAIGGYAIGRYHGVTLCDAIKDAHGCPTPTASVTR